jgi:hypothetical protein
MSDALELADKINNLLRGYVLSERRQMVMGLVRELGAIQYQAGLEAGKDAEEES